MLEQTKSMLAMQSPWAALHVHRRLPQLQPVQRQYDSLLDYYRDEERVNRVPTGDHSIVNLPTTMRALPRNTIYDRVLFIPNDCPDFRLVAVSRNVATSAESSLRSGDLTDTILGANCAVPVDSCRLLGSLSDAAFNESAAAVASAGDVNATSGSRFSVEFPSLFGRVNTVVRNDRRDSVDSEVVGAQSFAGALLRAVDETERTSRYRQLVAWLASDFADGDVNGLSDEAVQRVARLLVDA